MFIKKIEDELYHICKENNQVGSFRLMELQSGCGQIKEMRLVEQVAPVQILAVFELIQSYAQEQHFKELHVVSHSTNLNRILQHQQFVLEDVEKNLWIYKVNHK
ncbi:hypothetical protein LCL89_15625 [Halobacillus yeomjeoni]|nr:hypothetical protein [Halobacillus yeomjeoni]MCA0985465.1 hypothetical protein [Halobacillus yeomjeoni]